MKLIKAIKVHISMIKDGEVQSLCGHAPWKNPVLYFDGSYEEVTCEICKKNKKAFTGQVNTFSRA